MNHPSTLPPHTTNDVLQALVPLGLDREQRLDFAGWMAGLDEGRLVSLNELSAGERAAIVTRLHDYAPRLEALKAEWKAARTRQFMTASDEQEWQTWLR